VSGPRRLRPGLEGKFRSLLGGGASAAPDPAMPPKRIRFMGEDDATFLQLGDDQVAALRARAELVPSSRVLDIGCGYGRLAHSLQRSGFEGEYLGFDVMKPAIRWCERRLAEPGYEFRHVDVGNGRYNPAGSLTIPDVPLAGGGYDVICAFSVFTHMWPHDVDAYLALIGSALAPGGRAVISAFLLDETWQALADAGKAGMAMPHRRGDGCRFQSAEDPLHCVGYELDWLLSRAASHDLEPAGPPAFGTWSQRPVNLWLTREFQDLLTLRRAADQPPGTSGARKTMNTS
jgi:SAM-dependent methyltransferase